MTTIAEVTTMKIYTDEKILCTICNQNKNFVYVVKLVETQHYLLEMCPRCNKHCNDVKEISARVAKDYPAPQK